MVQLCKVVREVSVAKFEEEMDKWLGGWRCSSSGYVPPSEDSTGEWWAILVREG